MLIRGGEVEVVVKAVVDPGPDGDLRLGEGALDRHGHDVGRGVAEGEEGGIRFVRGQFFRFGGGFGGGGGYRGVERGGPRGGCGYRRRWTQ